MELSTHLKTYSSFLDNPTQALKQKGIAYTKEYNNAIKCFQVRINKDRVKENQKELPFMAIKLKLAGIQEVDDLRVFYHECLKYSYTKDKQGVRKTFTRAFFGALDTKEK